MSFTHALQRRLTYFAIPAIFMVAFIIVRPASLIGFLVSPGFVSSYIAMLAIIVAARIAADMTALGDDSKLVQKFSDQVTRSVGPANLASELSRLLDEQEPDSPKPKAVSDLMQSVRAVLQQARTVEPGGLTELGLIPSALALRAAGAGKRYDVSETADLVVRIALLGTFIGIIAALTIASNGISGGSDANRLADMQQFIQQLLATAAAKFWISAAGLAGAIFLRTLQGWFEGVSDRNIGAMASTLDRLFADDAFTAVFCKPSLASHDPIRDQLRALADEIKAAADQWVLTVRIGGAKSAIQPSVELARNSTEIDKPNESNGHKTPS